MGASLAIMEKLTKRQAIAFELHYAQGLSIEDTARSMEIGPRRVNYLTSAARRRLVLLGAEVLPLPAGRPKSATATGDSLNFDDI